MLDTRSPSLRSIGVAVSDFAELAGTANNRCAFCDVARQDFAARQVVKWVERHP